MEKAPDHISKRLRPKLCLLVPCYNEELTVVETVPVLSTLINTLATNFKIDKESFILFVDDGSNDNTFALLKQLRSGNQKILKLTNNRGHQTALLAGIDYVKHKVDCVISIDADLQDDLDVIDKMLTSYEQGGDIICGVREDRSTDSLFKKTSARFFYWIMKKMGVLLIENHADFRLLSNSAINELSRYKEKNLFLRGILRQMNLNLVLIKYIQKKRMTGKTKYTLKRMLSLAIKGVTSFTHIPIRIITITGFFFFIVTMCLSVNALFAYWRGDAVPGWTSITLPMYFLGGIQLLSLGVIGEYIAKIYIETKGRPLYHVAEVVE